MAIPPRSFEDPTVLIKNSKELVDNLSIEERVQGTPRGEEASQEQQLESSGRSGYRLLQPWPAVPSSRLEKKDVENMTRGCENLQRIRSRSNGFRYRRRQVMADVATFAGGASFSQASLTASITFEGSPAKPDGPADPRPWWLTMTNPMPMPWPRAWRVLAMSASWQPAAREGLRLIEEQIFDIIITDLIMDGIGGLEILAKAKRELPDAEVVILTGHGTIKTAVDRHASRGDDLLTKAPRHRRASPRS